MELLLRIILCVLVVISIVKLSLGVLFIGRGLRVLGVAAVAVVVAIPGRLAWWPHKTGPSSRKLYWRFDLLLLLSVLLIILLMDELIWVRWLLVRLLLVGV